MSNFVVYIAILTAAAIPFFEATFAVPLGILGGTNLLLTLLAGVIGNFLTIVVVVIFSEKVRNWFIRDKESKRNRRAEGIWKKFGFYGFILLGPILLSSHVTAIAAVSFGAPKMKTIVYVTASIIIWTVILAVLAYIGMDLLGLEDVQLLKKYLN